MKKIQSVKTSVNRKILTPILTVIIALMLLAIAAFVVNPQPTARAETGGTVTLHVYDPAQKYTTLAGWVWLKGSSGKECSMTSTAANDEQFYKEYTQDGKTERNTARRINVSFTADEIASLKGGKQLGFLVCASTGTAGTDFWTRYAKEGSDVFVSLTNAFDSNNHADVYYVRKDTTAYTDLQEAIRTLEKITSARFTAKTASTVSVEFEVTTPMSGSVQASLYDGKTLLGQSNVTINTTNRCVGSVTFNTVFDFAKSYSIKVGNIPKSCGIAGTVFIDDVNFIKTYETADTQNQVYGAIYSKQSTVFRVWAPFATAVTLNIYDNGSSGMPENQYEMTKRIPQSATWGGVWEYTLDGDQKGKYYTYSVNNSGAETETIDPYAKACGANGTRGMVVDLKSTDPVGWDADKNWYKSNAVAVDTPIIWEVTVSDFSSSADSGMKYKGKYLAFTEQNTTVPGRPDLKTGVNYLKDLGITYVHLNPVYDFATVDEGDMTRADSGSFNWGYDPQNYNIPEGSYSTDPSDGAVRINEFKRMVKALHDAGIGVVMDVVYNHTYAIGGQALHDTVPNYYHRTDANGEFTNGSGCGNETASERTMVRKYIVDSMKYWAEEYHIDGFRFDLMGVHDLDTIKAVRSALDGLVFDTADRTNNGKRILIYGEPWSADGCYVPPSYTKRVAASKAGVTGYALNSSTNKLVKNMFAGYDNDYPRDMTALPDRVAVFNDMGREGIRGNNDPGNGWVNGAPGMVGQVMHMMEGGAGTSGKGMKTGAGSRNVAYAAAHDNYTLWDQVRGYKHYADSPLSYDAPTTQDIKRCKLAAATYLTATGMSFMLAGDEMGRTKFGNENSYNSPSKLNQIVWSRQAEFKELYNFNKQLIALRKKYSTQLFSYSKSTAASFCYGNFGDNLTNYTTGYFKFTRTQNSKTLTVELNPTTRTGSVKIGTDPAVSI